MCMISISVIAGLKISRIELDIRFLIQHGEAPCWDDLAASKLIVDFKNIFNPD